ncbi:hypothetical protein [Gluconobacter kondonii]|nr:hypothetical protein [Gluconobacter kondonii]
MSEIEHAFHFAAILGLMIDRVVSGAAEAAIGHFLLIFTENCPWVFIRN